MPYTRYSIIKLPHYPYCSQTVPCCTIGEVVGKLGPGDTARILRGVYEEEVDVTVSGTPGNPITFVSVPSGAAHVSSSSWAQSPEAFRLEPGISNVIIDGFEISGFDETIYLSGSVPTDHSNIEIRNVRITGGKRGLLAKGTTGLVIKNVTVTGLRAPAASGAEGISISNCRNVLVSDCQAIDNRDGDDPSNSDADGFHAEGASNILFERCIAKGNTEDGFDLTGKNITLDGCVADGHGACGIKLWIRGDTGVHDYYIHNTMLLQNVENGIKATNGPTFSLFHNLFYQNGEMGIWTKSNGGQDVVIKNNIFVENALEWSQGAIYVDPAGSVNLVSDYNLFDSNAGGRGTTATQDLNSIDADPLFETPGSNFYLRETSPAIDLGIDVGVTHDFRSLQRPKGSGFDIGPYEYDPNPPTASTSQYQDLTSVSVNQVSSSTCLPGTEGCHCAYDIGCANGLECAPASPVNICIQKVASPANKLLRNQILLETLFHFLIH